MFESLTQRLSHAVQRMSGRGRITEENIRDVAREIRRALLEADVALPVVKGLIYRVQRRALGTEVAKSVNPGQAFVKIVHDELIEVLGGSETGIEPRGRPTTIMLVGLQGTGKTTTAAKLARFLAHSSDEVLLASTDVYRPAARTRSRAAGPYRGTDSAQSLAHLGYGGAASCGRCHDVGGQSITLSAQAGGNALCRRRDGGARRFELGPRFS